MSSPARKRPQAALQYSQHPFILCRRARRLGAPSSQSPLRSGRPGVGIPRCAPLLLLSHLNPLTLGFKWGPGECYRGRPPHPALRATFPPGWGRLVGCVLQASPLRGEAVERSETDEGTDGRRTGDISPPCEVLSMDGKYPKILGPAGPNPERTFRPCPKFVRRGHELGAAASSARCRSHLSNSRFPSFPPRASRMPCLSGSVGFVPRSM